MRSASHSLDETLGVQLFEENQIEVNKRCLAKMMDGCGSAGGNGHDFLIFRVSEFRLKPSTLMMYHQLESELRYTSEMYPPSMR